MDSPRILSLPRSDESHGVVLLHVLHTGPARLDLALTATEGESPYTAVVKQSRLGDLRLKNYQGTDEEWTQIISLVLGQSDPTDQRTLVSGIEVSASIAGSDDENKEVVITIRKRVQDITQRLGSIVLKQDDEQAIELFEWSSIAATRTNTLETQLASLTDRCRVAEDTINKLSEQLSQLVQAKDKHESHLLSHFAQLLNEKKLKIRNQQRLLASATVDPDKVAGMQATVGQLQGPMDKRYSAKRHAQDISSTDEDTMEAPERMELDQTKADDLLDGEVTDDEGRSTPQPLEEGEVTTTDDEDELPTGTELTAREQTRQPEALERPQPPKEAPPPRRELPFNRRGPPKTAAPEPAGEVTAGETDDDEL